ncbi:hypothetical protein FRC20_012065 [Serendipita sp. 405]|nr:hypothetical protein FRC20_012065 [Serendipita sp. 405]
MSGYSGGTESRAPTSIVTHQYPPAASSGTGGSSEPSSYDPPRPIQQQQQQQSPPSRHGPPSRIQQPLPQQMYAIEPSEVGESVIIDRSDYIPPPSYSPPATNHARQSSTRSKAIYDVSRTDGRDSLAPPLPTDLRNTTSQNLSATDVDIIARRVVDLMRSGSSVGGSSVTGFGEGTGSDYSTATADHPQVQQAVRRLLAKEEPHLLSSSQPRPEKS